MPNGECELFFFFQAEGGIRDLTVTGVQTCALPIYPEPAAAHDLWVYGSKETVTIAVSTRVREGERPDAIHWGALEILHEEETLHGLFPVRRDLESSRIEELDVHDLRIVGRLPHVGSAGQSEGRNLIAHHRKRRYPEILNIYADGQQAGHEGTIDHARRLVMVPARDHNPPPAHDGAGRGPQLCGKLGRYLDIGEPRNSVAAEE